MRPTRLAAAIVAVLIAALFAIPATAAAQEDPSAPVRDAICDSASVDAVSFPADGRVADAESRLEDATADRVAAAAEADRVDPDFTGDNPAPRIAELRTFLDGDPTAEERAIAERRLAARLAEQRALTRETEATDALARARAAQADAVDLEADVAAFVGDRDYDEVRADLCTTATPTPTPAPTTTTAPPTIENNVDVDVDNNFDQIPTYPRGGVSTGGGDLAEVVVA